MATITAKAIERDEAGKITAIYVQSRGALSSSNDESSRVDVIVSGAPSSIDGFLYACCLTHIQVSGEEKIPWRSILNVFLPAGYPHSVTSDYLE
jgi:hypothetical protein